MYVPCVSQRCLKSHSSVTDSWEMLPLASTRSRTECTHSPFCLYCEQSLQRSVCTPRYLFSWSAGTEKKGNIVALPLISLTGFFKNAPHFKFGITFRNSRRGDPKTDSSPQWAGGNWRVCGRWSSQPCDSDNAAAWCSFLSTGYGHTMQVRDTFRCMRRGRQKIMAKCACQNALAPSSNSAKVSLQRVIFFSFSFCQNSV